MSDQKPVAERRKLERRSLRGTATVVLSSGHTFDVRTTDINTEGIGIVASANPKQGTAFKIKVSLPMRPTGLVKLEVNAKVVHSILAGDEGGFKIGLRFSSLTPDAEAAIRRYVE
jgi:c-di-GMP-binding flagellar brake protein YcgR